MLVSTAHLRGWVGGGGVVETLFGRRPRVLVSYLTQPDAATLHGLYSGEGQPGHGDRAG